MLWQPRWTPSTRTPVCRSGVLTGAGGTFCAGMDLQGLRPWRERGSQGSRSRVRPPAKPLIAAVEGYATAGGTELALATDLIVAARNSAFGIPEVKRGLVAAGGRSCCASRNVRTPIAMELALTGENLPAERAHELGLVNVLAEPGPRRADRPSRWPSGSPPTARSRLRQPSG